MNNMCSNICCYRRTQKGECNILTESGIKACLYRKEYIKLRNQYVEGVNNLIIGEDGALRIDMGFGKFGVATGEGNKTKTRSLIIYKLAEPEPIGNDLPYFEGMNTLNTNTQLVMPFHNIESLDVVIDALQTIKDEMIEKKENREGNKEITKKEQE